MEDLHGENFLLIRRGWNRYLDQMRDELWRDHPQIRIVDFEMFNINVFNQCENSEDILMTIDNWRQVHPLLKTIPVDWSYPRRRCGGFSRRFGRCISYNANVHTA